MSASKRADTLGALQKVLQKHYKPHKSTERPVLEQLLYACCLEDSKPDAADEAFARLQESFFDWNEVRVTTVRELSELLRGLRDPERAATAIKQTLHSVYEAIYDFNLDGVLKLNLGIAVKQLEGYRGTTPFVISYVVQNVLGGHAIPISRAAFEIMTILGIASEKEAELLTVPGLERAIPKTKGAEFASLLQQFSAEYAAAPFGTSVRNLILEIDPTAKDRFPKRTTVKKPEAVEVEKADGKKKDEDKDDKKKSPSATPTKSSAKSLVKPKELEKKELEKKVVEKKAIEKKAAEKKEADRKETDRKEAEKKDAEKAKAKHKSPEKPDKKLVKKKPLTADSGDKKKTSKKVPPKSITKKAAPGAKKSASKQLARRKPR